MTAMHAAGPAHELARAPRAMPQDVRLTPDGRIFLVADMLRNGVWVIDAATFRSRGFVHTGQGRARHLPLPRRVGDLRLQPRRGHRQRPGRRAP